MYTVTSYHLEPGKVADFRDWLLTDEAQAVFDQLEEEAGMRYVDTYFTILGFGEYDAETWFELRDWGSLDDVRASDAGAKWTENILEFTDQSRGVESRALRTPEDVQIAEQE